jgi:prepilin-type N-terminal cleavage/methylation domain-containing protein
MMQTKQSFSLIELLIVVVIIALAYGFSASSFNFSIIPKEKISLKNLRTMLLKQHFNEEISFKCLEAVDECWTIADGNVIKKEPNIFNEDNLPRVYNYSTDYDEITFSDYSISEFDISQVIFDLSLNKNGLKKEMIVEYNNKVYIFNSLYEFPVVVEDISSIDDYFQKRINEVKDAF